MLFTEKGTLPQEVNLNVIHHMSRGTRKDSDFFFSLLSKYFPDHYYYNYFHFVAIVVNFVKISLTEQKGILISVVGIE